MQEAANSTLKVTAYGRYGTRNPSFRVLDGETATEKFNSLVGFYSMIWNDFKFTKMQMAKTNVARALTQVKSTLESSETLIRSVENYQYIQSQFPTNLPVIPKALTAWIANVRTKQGVPLVLSQDTVVGPFIKPSIITQNNATIQGLVTTQDWFNETECNVTRCFRCAVIKTVLVEIKEFFDYCVEIDQGNLSVIKHINITDPIVATSNKTVDDSLILGLGKYINVAVGILFSSNMDPFNNTGEPLGIQFYLTYFVPIPFYSTCDRDINTTCEFGYGFGTGLIVLLLLTLGGLILWFIFPSTAGFLTTIISVVGYVIFALSIVLAVSWGLNPLCLQTPGLSIISFIVPLQLPILPECAVRDIANTLFSVFQQCYQFWKPLITDETLINATTGELTCPVCPGKLPLIDCQTVGFKNGWDEFVFGIYWMLSWFHVPLSVLPALPDGLNITLKLHQACFVWLLPSGAFWLGILVGLFILLPVILAIGMLLYGTYTMFANLAIFSYCY